MPDRSEDGSEKRVVTDAELVNAYLLPAQYFKDIVEGKMTNFFDEYGLLASVDTINTYLTQEVNIDPILKKNLDLMVGFIKKIVQADYTYDFINNQQNKQLARQLLGFLNPKIKSI